jgi:hypothetical protein
MSIAAGLEIRRRRTNQAARSVLAVLLTAVGLSLAAQVATAQPSVWGWIVVLPALACSPWSRSCSSGPSHRTHHRCPGLNRRQWPRGQPVVLRTSDQ